MFACIILRHWGMSSNSVQRTEVDKRCDDVSVGSSLTFFSLFSFSGNRTKWDELKHTDFTNSPPLCRTYTMAVKICNWKRHHHWLQQPFRHHLKTRAFRKKQRRMKHQRVLSEELVCDFRQCSWFPWHLPAKYLQTVGGISLFHPKFSGINSPGNFSTPFSFLSLFSWQLLSMQLCHTQAPLCGSNVLLHQQFMYFSSQIIRSLDGKSPRGSTTPQLYCQRLM